MGTPETVPTPGPPWRTVEATDTVLGYAETDRHRAHERAPRRVVDVARGRCEGAEGCRRRLARSVGREDGDDPQGRCGVRARRRHDPRGHRSEGEEREEQPARADAE